MGWDLARWGGVWLAVASLQASMLGAQRPTRALPRADIEFPEPFTTISGVRELPDGRVLVADSREKTLQLLDLARGTSTAVGREGAGPNEWGLPSRLYALPGDSTLMIDAANSRYFYIGPGGVPAGTARIPDLVPHFFSELVGIDGAGRMLFVASRRPARPADGSTGVADVLLHDPRRGRVDTIATLAQPRGEVTAARILPGGRMRMVTNRPLAAHDLAGIAPDGRIAIVRAASYRVEWIGADGSRRVGPEAPSPNIRVTEAEKQAFLAGQERAGPVIVRGPSGAAPPRTGAPRGTGEPARRPPAMRPSDVDALLDPDMTWPAVKPPFLVGAVHVAPDGRVWVLRTRAHDDPVPVYDVFDGAGRVAERIALPAGTRLVGFGRGTVYLARTDGDDLVWLARVRSS